MKDGLSQLSVMTIHQDELGRMWFGTEEGLCVYNGNNIISYKHSQNNSEKNENGSDQLGNENFPIVGDEKGSLYFVSDYKKLIRYDLRQERFETLIANNVGTVSYIDNRVWVGVQDSLMIWNTESRQAELQFVLKGKRIQKIFIDTAKKIWIGTPRGLFCIADGETPTLIIPDEDIYTLFEDSKGNLWIGTRETGMYIHNKEGVLRKFTHTPSDPYGIPSNQVRCFTEDNYGNIWIGTFRGLTVYNPSRQTFTVHAKDNLPGSLKHSSVFSIFKDKQGTIWAGTYYGGVHYFNPEMDFFTLYSADQERDDCLSNHFVGRMVEDKYSNIWICTEGGGLNFLDRKTRRFTHYMRNEAKNSITHNNLKGICYSPTRERLYIGTHTGGLSIYDIRTKTFKNIPVIEDITKTYASDVVNHVELYNDQYLFVLTRSGILYMDLDTEEFTLILEYNKDFNGMTFLVDSKGAVWAQRGNGLLRLNLENPEERTIYPGGEAQLDKFSVLKIVEDRDGRIYLATRGSGLFKFDQNTHNFIRYSAENNLLQSNYCYEVSQSIQGFLIITGDKGLSLLDPDKMSYRPVGLETALPISGINSGCGLLVCKNGEVFVGGVNGMTSFFEESFHTPPKDHELYFSSLSVNNEPIYAYSSGGIINESLPYCSEINLKHNQNNLIISFASNSYTRTSTKLECEYMLEGYDGKWIEATGSNISYTNLNPGRYTLNVREIISDQNQIEDNLLRLPILIQAPWYASTFAYFIYTVLIILSVYFFNRFKQSQLLLKATIVFERKEKNRIEELNKEKLQFFSNISHEFRTPLTLIISQIELLIQNQKLSPSVYNRLIKVYKHSFNMKTLITELLDFRKFDQGYAQLKIKESNITPFVHEVFLSFSEMAEKEGITYHFKAQSEEIKCWFDQLQLKKVLTNLLSNAFKFTEKEGTIDCTLEETEQEIIIKIIDSGTGIETDDLPKVFDTFYQGTNQPQKEKRSVGSGLGLALSKNIISLHHGDITAESKPGYGSAFIIKLLKGKEHFENDSVVQNPERIESDDHHFTSVSFEEQADEENEELFQKSERDRYSILIIEDNEELLQLLSSLFSPIYKVSLARNGKEGLEIARATTPDIILSDVMMPEMTGTEMCMHIKNDFTICHIPVILLTALSSPEQNIEGLSRGADAYISKPFDSRVLVARCNSILKNRILLQNKFSSQQEFNAASLATNPIDQEFLDTIHRILSENITNEAFDVNEMARQIGLSRSSFYAKFKSLTGMTPNDFILEYKLKTSAKLLEENFSMQVSDIASAMGFGSPRYFSRCFKVKYGISPAEYRSNKQAEKSDSSPQNT